MNEHDESMEITKEIAQPFWVNAVSSNPPKFVVLTGGVGSGKTTIRREKYSDGYVNFDFGEITAAVEKAVGKENPQLHRYVIFTCALILEIALSSKKDIVIEIIGDSEAVIVPLVNGMTNIGYDVSIVHVTADPVVAYQRHIEAVANDKDYLSSYFTQKDTLFFFYNNLGLGEMPSSSEE